MCVVFCDYFCSPSSFWEFNEKNPYLTIKSITTMQKLNMQSRANADLSKPNHQNNKFKVLGRSESAGTDSPMLTPVSDPAT